MPNEKQVAAQLEIKPTTAMNARTAAVIGSAAFLALLLVFLLIGGNGDFFAQRTTITTYLPDATGLSTISEVRLAGIRIGNVTYVGFSGSLDPQRAVRVNIRMLKRFLKNIPVDSQTDIDTDTLVGSAFVDISPGKSPVQLGENGVLQSEPLKAAEDRADQIRVLQSNFSQIDDLLVQASSPNTQLGQFVMGSAEYDKVMSGIGDFDRSLHTLITPQSQLGQAFYSLDMYNRIHALITNVDATLQSIQNGQGTAGKLLASDDQYNAALKQISSLRKTLADLNAGKGGLGVMLQDDATYLRLQRLLASTDASIASLTSGEGRVGQLLASEQLYESLRGSLQSMEELIRDVRDNPRKYLRFRVRGGGPRK